ncbi:undecaprenyl-phosphate glucose phosphotransferase [Zavarzinella formosa]|uniref:undecaprenyl-phosphate glucose phosphotransferase n=1 Tax=Zavarzinella formosa TaxID=360055 RepID=UPI00037B9C6A|nr:undecaprenyl-phosphate glucose phosphotransferase [Zavarzinella formosa]
MIKRRSQSLAVLIASCDLLAVVVAWMAAYQARFSGWFPVTKEQPPVEWVYQDLPVVGALAIVAFWLAKNYEISRLRRLREEIWAVSKGIPLLVLLITGVGFYVQDPYVSRGAMTLFAGIAFVTVLTFRRLTWGLIHLLRRRGYNPTFSMIVGTGRVARKTANALRSASWMGIRNVGFVEDNPTRWSSDLDILGRVANLSDLIKKYNVEHVFIALPMNRFHEARQVFTTLSQELVEVRLIADVPNLAGWTLTTTFLEGMPVVGLRESPHFGVNVWVKRIMDIAFSLFALLVLSPVMLAIAIAVKITSRGPVFYRQERCGLNGRSFHMLKFRSMREDSETATGPVMTTKNDPRRTPIGTFLRQTSLDELPQFFNVLLGDMSVVGPRPERPEFISQFQKTIPNYMARHAVKSGITGWAQVNGWRGNTSLRKRIQFDLYYIVHWNPIFDMRIMWLTVWNGLVHRNAY